ncbi:PEP-CTERM sorting domain-containing protein [Halochromatium roseum]|uniref:PEP-CTERM sorting domain-containing protein n=1 Tax=Halochromatium roseum TaxID=391920 RepID=UPI001911FD76|nr:PEP-CTERM sorting domain-containing protein [Halochromatium roseum]MBK5940406.1 hypothetical protein [Halochromatium roseum]
MKNYLISGLLAVSALLPLSATAVPLNGTFAAAGLNGPVTITGGNLNTADSITSASLLFGVTGIDPTYLGEDNDFFTNADFSVPSAGTISLPLAITTFNPITNFLTWGAGNRFQFDLDTLVRNVSEPNFMNLYGTGEFRDTTNFYDTQTAAIAFSAQSVGGSISYSFSWGTPPFSNPVPEPTTLALLGMGLIGLGAARRRKSA